MDNLFQRSPEDPDTYLPDPDRSWMSQANCLGVEPDLFFPERGESVKEAKTVCSDCGVRRRCLEYALVNGEKFGIWGGMSERERRKIRKQRMLATSENKVEDSPS
jgi:WhiB family redox-sensing transcriptional regulator